MYDKDAEAAARFYAETFPNSSMGAVKLEMAASLLEIAEAAERLSQARDAA